MAKSDRKPALPDSMRGIAGSSGQASQRELQTLGVMVPKGDSYWVFKLQDEPEVVSELREEFLQIVASLKFQDSNPEWQLAEGWVDKKALGGMTYAELLKESEGIRATVTKLPMINSWQQTVTANVNRWRGQLALDENADWETIQNDLEEVDGLGEGSDAAYFVSLVGKGSGGMGGPFQQAMQQSNGQPPAPGASEEGGTGSVNAEGPQSNLKYNEPEGWTKLEVPSGSMRKAAFSVAGDDGQGEVTLVAAGGDERGNMSMWLGQVQVEPTDDVIDKAIAQVEKLEVNGTQTRLYFLDGESGESGESILVANVPWKDGESLYVKLKGDAALVIGRKPEFLQFLSSLSW
ncbi:MAG: hypothetical protein AB8B50_11235 [Pirellulaceae bacterium]